MRTIVLFLPNWIGDVVMATPAVAAVRRHFPTSRIIGVCTKYVAETVAGSPRFDRILTFDKARPWDLIRELHRERAEGAVLFPNSFRAALLARLGGCSRVVGFARYFRDSLLSDRLYPKRGTRGEPRPSPVIDDYNRLAVKLGTPDPGHRMELFTTAVDDANAATVWASLGLNRYRTVVGINPGGAFGASKHWPHFGELARYWAAQRGVGVLVLCGPAERDEAKRIVAAANHPNAVSLADQSVSIGLTKAMTKRLSALITTDSGPRHFATAFGVPTITLFGPTHIGWTETYASNARHLQLSLDCGPCQQRVCPQGHHRCMTDLTPSMVISAVDSLLAAGVRHAG
ncbi:MAG: glycosyltransferase family 9 protein [Gemmataceae bacterium]